MYQHDAKLFWPEAANLNKCILPHTYLVSYYNIKYFNTKWSRNTQYEGMVFMWYPCLLICCPFHISNHTPPQEKIPYIIFKHFDFVQSRCLLLHKHDALWQSSNLEAFPELKFKKSVIFFGNTVTLHSLNLW